MSERAHVEVLLEKERLLNRITHQLHDARDLDEILLFLKNELLIASKEIKELILNRAHVEEIRRTAINEGMRTLKQDGIRKVFEGLTDFTQVREVCIE
jgi:hypothetical protein